MIPKIVGLTGGIGSGKSTARKILQSMHVPCLDADMVAREIHQQPGHPALAEIALAFPGAITEDGRLSRGSLRNVFADPVANDRLKSILGPYVVRQMSQWAAKQRAPYLVWESALIIEAKIPVDRVLVIDATHELQLERVRARDPSWGVEQIGKIFALQLDRAERVQYAHDMIDNSGSLEELKAKVEALHRRYLDLWGAR